MDFAKIGHIDLRPNEVSGGEQQRAAFIGRSSPAQSIFADEPTGNLDLRERLIDLIKDINSTYKTAIVMTHSKENAKAAQRELVLKDGVIYDEKRQ